MTKCCECVCVRLILSVGRQKGLMNIKIKAHFSVHTKFSYRDLAKIISENTEDLFRKQIDWVIVTFLL